MKTGLIISAVLFIVYLVIGACFDMFLGWLNDKGHIHNIVLWPNMLKDKIKKQKEKGGHDNVS